MVDPVDWGWNCLRLNLRFVHHGLEVLWSRDSAKGTVVHSHGVLSRGWLWLQQQLSFTGRCGRLCGLSAELVPQLPQMARRVPPLRVSAC